MATAQKTGNPPPKHKTAGTAPNPAPEVMTITEQEQAQTGDVWDFLVNSLDTMKQHAIGIRDTQRQMQQALSQSFGSIGFNGQSRPALPAPQPQVQQTAPTTAAAPPPKHKPAATAAAPAAAPAAAATTTPTEEGGKKKVTPGERNYENDMSLVEAVYEVLDRAEYAEGLRVGEIVDVIEKEKKWQSASDDISNMVQGAVYKLKEKGKVVRGESRKYYIPEGSTPPEGRKGGKAEGEE